MRIFHDIRIFPKIVQFRERVFPLSVFNEKETANTPFGGRQQALAKRAWMITIFDGKTFAFPFILSGGDGLAGNEQVVEPSGTGEAGFIGYIQKIV